MADWSFNLQPIGFSRFYNENNGYYKLPWLNLSLNKSKNKTSDNFFREHVLEKMQCTWKPYLRRKRKCSQRDNLDRLIFSNVALRRLEFAENFNWIGSFLLRSSPDFGSHFFVCLPTNQWLLLRNLKT